MLVFTRMIFLITNIEHQQFMAISSKSKLIYVLFYYHLRIMFAISIMKLACILVTCSQQIMIWLDAFILYFICKLYHLILVFCDQMEHN